MLPTEEAVYYGFAIISAVLILVLPTILNSMNRMSMTCEELRTLTIFVLLELATLVLSVGMHNFSLGFCMASVYAPFALLIKMPSQEKPGKFSK